MGRTRRALEDGPAFLDLQQHEIQGPGDRRVGQFAPEHGLQRFQAGLAGDLVRAGDAGAHARIHPGEHVALFGQPFLEGVPCAHRTFLSNRNLYLQQLQLQ